MRASAAGTPPCPAGPTTARIGDAVVPRALLPASVSLRCGQSTQLGWGPGGGDWTARGRLVPPWCWVSGSLQSLGPLGSLGRWEGSGQVLLWKGIRGIFLSYPRHGMGVGGVGRNDRQWHHFFSLRCSQFARKHVFDWAEPLGRGNQHLHLADLDVHLALGCHGAC